MPGGKITIYVGEGKGKTTGAFGYALSQVAIGKKVKIIQYLKGSTYSGEIYSARHFFPHLEVLQFGYGCPWSTLIKNGLRKCTSCGECFRLNRDPSLGLAQLAWQKTCELLLQDDLSVLILDEFNHAVRHGFIAREEIGRVFASLPENKELVLTGRKPPQFLLEFATRLVEFKEIKHPWRAGITSRRGIEY